MPRRTVPRPFDRLSRVAAFPIALAVALAACGERVADEAAAPVGPPDNPVEDIPPATAPAAAAATASGQSLPDFTGFGPARFGGPAEAVRQAWGRPLDGEADEPGGCYYLMPTPRPEGRFDIAFMIEGERFVRVDVADAARIAPGGGKVGMRADEIRALYPKVETQPHKYTEGAHYLRVPDPAGGAGVLLFETDADGRVTGWRVGLPPQVDYVEGCA